METREPPICAFCVHPAWRSFLFALTTGGDQISIFDDIRKFHQKIMIFHFLHTSLTGRPKMRSRNHDFHTFAHHDFVKFLSFSLERCFENQFLLKNLLRIKHKSASHTAWGAHFQKCRSRIGLGHIFPLFAHVLGGSKIFATIGVQSDHWIFIKIIKIKFYLIFSNRIQQLFYTTISLDKATCNY